MTTNREYISGAVEGKKKELYEKENNSYDRSLCRFNVEDGEGNLTNDETDLPSDICIKSCCYMNHILYTVNTLFRIIACVGVRACVGA